MVEITRRKWKNKTSISRTGLFWPPEGKRKRGSSRAARCKTSEKELEDLGPVVQSPISANPGLTLNKTYGVNPGLALIGL